jgi:non-specific serine/threonine protein kinase/serine/threonine-protein kinase
LTSDRWLRIKSIFSAALELSGDARAAYTARMCGADAELRREIEALLESSEEAPDFIETPVLGDLRGMIGRRIGPYRVTELIGEGGMGFVYAAVREDQDFQQKIAIKLVKRGMDTEAVLRRFRTERQILARLEHPNIARLFDGGITSDGLPYFVMEYLPGTPIHQYCEDRKLTLEDRLRLFLPVCAAVQFAHQNLVIHRDIKATNILVTEDGTPKLLDFGIAKLLSSDTSPGASRGTVTSQRMMTPDYASPEQMRGDPITTAADVYSLGVLLYEILASRRPFDLSSVPTEEIGRRIATVDPTPPSGAAPHDRARNLTGDLDTIVMTAMQKEAERRYPSAQALAEDIRRYLDGLPLLARRDTIRYRTVKYVRRHKAGVAAAAATFVGLIAGGGVAIWQAAEAATEREAAERRFHDVRDLANALLFELDEALTALPGATYSRQLLMKRVLQYLDNLSNSRFADTALRRELAVAYERSGDVQGGAKSANLGDSAGALQSYRKAVEFFERLAREHPQDLQFLRDLARGYSKLSDVLAIVGDHGGALEFDRKMLAILERLAAAAPQNRELREDTGAAYQEIAGDLSRAGDMAGALDYRKKSFAVYEQLYKEDPARPAVRRGYALASKRLGRLLGRNGDMESARRCFQIALEIENANLAQDPVNVANRTALSLTYVDAGDTYVAAGRLSEALAEFKKALAIREELAAADPRDFRINSMLAATHIRIGRSLLKLNRESEARPHLETALKQRLALSAINPSNAGAREEVAESYAVFGDAAIARGDCRDAAGWFAKAHAVSSELHARGQLGVYFTGELKRIESEMERCGVRPQP